jgi:hypothetical protein
MSVFAWSDLKPGAKITMPVTTMAVATTVTVGASPMKATAAIAGATAGVIAPLTFGCEERLAPRW